MRHRAADILVVTLLTDIEKEWTRRLGIWLLRPVRISAARWVTIILSDFVWYRNHTKPVLYLWNKISTIHDLTLLNTYNSDKNWFIYRFKQLVGRFVFRSVIRHSSHVITPTHFTKNEIMERYHTKSDKITVTHLAAEMRTRSLKPYNQASSPFLLYVGQQSDYKNIRRLGDAHQQLLQTHPELQLVLVGKIDAAATRNKTYFETKQYKNIHFTGFVEDDELNWLFANTACYVFPSLMEGFGLPALEAMTHHAPVASSNATCLPEVYGDAAHYFDPTNTDEIAHAINDILTNPSLRDRLIERGDKQVKLYSWRKTAEETLAVYKKYL